MASLIIPDLDEDLRARLEARAADRGRSVEEEAREILEDVLQATSPGSGRVLYESIRKIVEPLGGIELTIPPRKPTRPPPDFNSPDFDSPDSDK
jgi:plasmid stability protein